MRRSRQVYGRRRASTLDARHVRWAQNELQRRQPAAPPGHSLPQSEFAVRKQMHCLRARDILT